MAVRGVEHLSWHSKNKQTNKLQPSWNPEFQQVQIIMHIVVICRGPILGADRLFSANLAEGRKGESCIAGGLRP